MTKPLIQQLAERAGVNLEAAPALWHPGFIATILFELCAYLDEREKGKPEPLSEQARRERRPPPPDELVGALHDRIHPPSGNLISASPVRVKKREAAESSKGEWRKCSKCRGSGIVPASGEYLSDHCSECRGGMVWVEPPAAPEVAGPDCPDRTQETIASRYAGGDCVSDLAEDYGCTEVQIITALRTTLRYLLTQHPKLDDQLSEARAELASRCDHHAAIHELNRELVEAREALAGMEAHNDRWSARQATAIIGLEAELAKVKADSQLGLDERNGVLHAVLAKVTAERDELKTELAREKAWDLHTKVAMGNVVETWAGMHDVSQGMVREDHPGLYRALTAAAAKPPEL